MSIDYAPFYKKCATDMNAMLLSIEFNEDALNQLHILLEYMIDLTYNLDFDVNQVMLDIYFVLKMDVLNRLNIFPKEKIPILPGVLALNKHTKQYINADLTDYLNNEVWENECIPYEWALASEKTGEDILNWNICEPSE